MRKKDEWQEIIDHGIKDFVVRALKDYCISGAVLAVFIQLLNSYFEKEMLDLKQFLSNICIIGALYILIGFLSSIYEWKFYKNILKDDKKLEIKKIRTRYIVHKGIFIWSLPSAVLYAILEEPVELNKSIAILLWIMVGYGSGALSWNKIKHDFMFEWIYD